MECRRRPHAKKKQVWTEGIMAKAVSMCVYTYVLTNTHIRCVPWFVIITAKDDILGLSDQKCLYLYGSYSEMLRSCGCYSIVVNVLLRTARRQSLNATFKSGHWKLRLATRALFTTERRSEFRPEVTFSQTCLEHRSVQTEGNFMKLS